MSLVTEKFFIKGNIEVFNCSVLILRLDKRVAK